MVGVLVLGDVGDVDGVDGLVEARVLVQFYQPDPFWDSLVEFL